MGEREGFLHFHIDSILCLNISLCHLSIGVTWRESERERELWNVRWKRRLQNVEASITKHKAQEKVTKDRHLRTEQNKSHPVRPLFHSVSLFLEGRGRLPHSEVHIPLNR